MNAQLEKELLTHFERLVKEGDELCLVAQNARSELIGQQLSRVSAWLTQSESLLLSITPAGGPYYAQLRKIVEGTGGQNGFFLLHSNHHIHLPAAVGCLRGAYEDFKAKRLVSVLALIQAEVFSDFLEMAEHLLERKYKDAAAVIVGAVLEQRFSRRPMG